MLIRRGKNITQGGKVKGDGVTDGKFDGPREVYYENGQLKIKGSYKYGEEERPVEYYDQNGQISLKGSFKDGEFDGLFEFYIDGKVYSKTCNQNRKEVDLTVCESK